MKKNWLFLADVFCAKSARGSNKGPAADAGPRVHQSIVPVTERA